MSFRTYRADLLRAIRNASFAEIDAQYKAGLSVRDGVAAIRKSRAADKAARKAARRPAWDDGEGGDFDYSMNG